MYEYFLFLRCFLYLKLFPYAFTSWPQSYKQSPISLAIFFALGVYTLTWSPQEFLYIASFAPDGNRTCKERHSLSFTCTTNINGNDNFIGLSKWFNILAVCIIRVNLSGNNSDIELYISLLLTTPKNSNLDYRKFSLVNGTSFP